MRITIVPEDRTVIVDGIRHTVDCSSIDSSIHAVQWYEDYGDVEFKIIDGAFSPNQQINTMDDYQKVLDLWNVENRKPIPEHLDQLVDTQTRIARFDLFSADVDRQNLMTLLQQQSPDELRQYVNQNVTNLDAAKNLLAAILVAIAPMA